MTIAIAVALGLMMAFAIVVRTSSDPEKKKKNQQLFNSLPAHEREGLNKFLLAAAAPLSGLPYANPDEESSTYHALRTKLSAAGGVYGGQVAIYLSVQIAAGIASLITMVILLFSSVQGLLLIAGVAFAGIIAYYPYSYITDRAKKRAEKINQSLPEFAELLIMPLSSGYGILPALDFTAQRLEGPVADEVKALLGAISTRARSDKQAFEDAGERLGTPAAMGFFTSLSQAYLEGVGAVDMIAGQAEQLRKLAYEHTRAKLKILPNKLVVIMGLHLMPTLFVVILLPLLYGFTQVGQ